MLNWCAIFEFYNYHMITGGAVATSEAMKIHLCNFTSNKAVTSSSIDDSARRVGDTLKASSIHGGAILSSHTVRSDRVSNGASDDNLDNVDNNRISRCIFTNNTAADSGCIYLL
jgi:hypothetical protein